MTTSVVWAAIVGASAMAILARPSPSSEMASKPSSCDYVNVDGQCVEAPDQDPGMIQCCDGSHSHATHRTGACSHHGGIC
jgi:hypothetical protein